MGISLSQGPFTYNRFDIAEGKKPDFLDVDKDGDEKESFKKAVKDKKDGKKDGKKDCGCKKETDCDCSDKKDVKEAKVVEGPAAKQKKEADRKKKENENQMAFERQMSKNKERMIADEDRESRIAKDTNYESVTITKEDVIAHLIESNYVNNEVSAEVVFNSISDHLLEKIEADITEGMMPLPKTKMANQANKAYGKEQQAVKSGDEAGANKQMQRQIAMKDPAGRKQGLFNKNANK